MGTDLCFKPLKPPDYPQKTWRNQGECQYMLVLDGFHIILGSTGDHDHIRLAVTVVEANARGVER